MRRRERRRNRIKAGLCAVVKSADYSATPSKRLINMGFTPGTKFQIERIAPLGDPVIVKIRNYFVAVRKEDLLAIDFEECVRNHIGKT